MGVTLDHTIVWCRDQHVSANFLADLLGLAAPTRFGPLLVDDEAFDEIFGRILERGHDHWGDPAKAEPHVINGNDGGRGVHFEDPDGHFLEIITRRYGSGGD